MGYPPADPNDPFPAAGNREKTSGKILRQKQSRYPGISPKKMTTPQFSKDVQDFLSPEPRAKIESEHPALSLYSGR